ncbi:unnamed protein product [Leptosia nina]|uniref:Lipase 3 n=1 Tax=Leptosia nina TaxID=320188 RepID=A0AAV1K710_9NEOP
MGPGSSLGYILAEEGYDVWMGNARGNYYSRKHRRLRPDALLNTDFWDFSWDEIGHIDVAAMIDYALRHTGRSRLHYIGFSQGTTTFFVLASLRPEYNNKIISMHALAPVAYMAHNKNLLFNALAPFSRSLERLANLIGIGEFMPNSLIFTWAGQALCRDQVIFQPICSSILFLIGGWNEKQHNSTMMPVIFGHTPAGSSVRQFAHYGQGIARNQFQRYDFGSSKNRRLYGQSRAPDYDLGKITIPVFLHYSASDPLAHVNDVERLYRELRNPVGKYRIQDQKFSHLDFVYGLFFCVVTVYAGRSPNAAYVEELLEHYSEGRFSDNIEEDATLDVPELVRKYGYPLEEHTVETSDGYILGVHRIPYGRDNKDERNRPVVFLMHGLLSSSADYVLMGPGSSIGYILAEEGFDVWMGNGRGNYYSRKHKRLRPDALLNTEFWDFSWDEIGNIDVAAMIDYALEHTGRSRLHYIGFSQGTTTFFVLASLKPEYNDKIISMHALAPVAYMANNRNLLFNALAPFSRTLTRLANLIGIGEFMPNSLIFTWAGQALCRDQVIFQPICSSILFLVGGWNEKQHNSTMMPVIFGHTPAGASVRQFAHYGQGIAGNKFRRFDFGMLKNLRVYGRIGAPDYDLGKITTPVFLHYSVNDPLAHVNDVDKLFKELRNPVGKFKIQDVDFSHLDFVYALISLTSAGLSPHADLVIKLVQNQDFGPTFSDDLVQDAILDVPGLARRYNYPIEEHTVLTPDGYLLGMHRIPHGRDKNNRPGDRPAVLVMHGLLGSSADYILSGPGNGLGYILAEEGYDVWLGNARGNYYSRKHLLLNPNIFGNITFWEFSWDEIGNIDLPTMIDYVLGQTGKTALHYIGMSQGTTSFFVMGSLRPDYNRKIISMQALAPVAYMKHSKNILFQALAPFATNIAALSNLIGLGEYLPNNIFWTWMGQNVCKDQDPLQIVCRQLFFFFGGVNKDQFNSTLLPVKFGHIPAGASIRQLAHYGQGITSGIFRRYDHGWVQNMLRYGSGEPPRYDLSRINCPVYLHYSESDPLADVIDVDRLFSELGGTPTRIRIPHKTFSHFDFLWAIDSKTLVYDAMIQIMKSLN